ncbi:MAG: SRPBCC domain-containing protein [Acidimicrobiales bacterium]
MHLTFPVRAPAEAWAALADPAQVAAALAGATAVACAEGGGMRLAVEVAIASVRGPWTGTVTPVDEHAVRVVGAGDVGSLDLVVRADADRTRLAVDGSVGGPLAAIGEALLDAAVRRTATDLLAALGARAVGPAEAPADPVPVATPVAAAPPGTAPTATVPAGAGRGRHRATLVLAALGGLAVGVVFGRRAPSSRR